MQMGSVKRQEEERMEQQRSFRMFLGTCAMITVGGIAYGVRRQLRKEKFTFNIKEHGSSAVLAAKAFLYGTLLCAGGFATGGAAICTIYDINSPQEFGDFMRAKVSPLWKKSPEFKFDEEKIKGMSEKEELAYWSKTIEETEVEQEETSGEGAAENKASEKGEEAEGK